MVCVEPGVVYPGPEELRDELYENYWGYWDDWYDYEDYWYDYYDYSYGLEFDVTEVAESVAHNQEQLDDIWDNVMYLYYDVNEICDEIGCWSDYGYYDDYYWYDDYDDDWYGDYGYDENWQEMCQA